MIQYVDFASHAWAEKHFETKVGTRGHERVCRFNPDAQMRVQVVYQNVLGHEDKKNPRGTPAEVSTGKDVSYYWCEACGRGGLPPIPMPPPVHREAVMILE
jgi:hypothetical protein